MTTLMQKIVTAKTMDNEKSSWTNEVISENLKMTTFIHPKLIITLKQDGDYCNGIRKRESRNSSFSVLLLALLPWIR